MPVSDVLFSSQLSVLSVPGVLCGVSLLVLLDKVVWSFWACSVSDVPEVQDDSEVTKGFQLRYEKIVQYTLCTFHEGNCVTQKRSKDLQTCCLNDIFSHKVDKILILQKNIYSMGMIRTRKKLAMGSGTAQARWKSLAYIKKEDHQDINFNFHAPKINCSTETHRMCAKSIEGLQGHEDHGKLTINIVFDDNHFKCRK